MLLGGLSSICLFVLLSASAFAAPIVVTDSFIGSAVIPSGQTSPVAVDPGNLIVRSDGAIGLGYSYRAAGHASGQLPGPFTYEEHGYLFFRNPADPTTMIGSQFSTGVFRLVPARGGASIEIADTAPAQYTSGVETGFAKLPPGSRSVFVGLLGRQGAPAYGYFTFTNPYGSFTGYATPDFVNFAIQISFAATPAAG